MVEVRTPDADTDGDADDGEKVGKVILQLGTSSPEMLEES